MDKYWFNDFGFTSNYGGRCPKCFKMCKPGLGKYYEHRTLMCNDGEPGSLEIKYPFYMKTKPMSPPIQKEEKMKDSKYRSQYNFMLGVFRNGIDSKQRELFELTGKTQTPAEYDYHYLTISFLHKSKKL